MYICLSSIYSLKTILHKSILDKIKDNIKQLLASEEEENLHLAFQLLQGLDNMEEFKDDLANTSHKRYLCLGYGFDYFLDTNILNLEGENYLDTGDFCLNEIPDFLLNYINTKTLILSSHQISSLSENFCILSTLEALHLSYNKFTHFPEVLGNMKTIETLDLSANKLKIITEDLVKMSNLEYLFLEYNNIDKLPDNIGLLQNLEEIHLWHNLLSTLPSSFAQLNMEHLNLSNNLFTFIPTAIYELKNLKRLDMSQNPIPEAVHEHIRKELKGVEVIF